MNYAERVDAAYRRGEIDVVVRMSQAEIERTQQESDPTRRVIALFSLARVALRDGDLQGAADRAEEALAVARQCADRSLEERPRLVLAAVARMTGDLARARTLFWECIAYNQGRGRPKLVYAQYHNLAFCELGLGDVDLARSLFAENRLRVFQQGWDDLVPYVCVADAALACAEGDYLRAARMVGAADSAFAALGHVPDPDDMVDLAAIRATAVAALGLPDFNAHRAQGHLLHPRTMFDVGRRFDDDRHVDFHPPEAQVSSRR
ncbi:tetratricopeptide repeat protein [Catellatospora citrea]|uniref:Tetratricopeptide repeat protein n=1 Tax=Catellatospora citrea TaxID=53366 RepID=A0A8J3KHA7_9ACTN|nr:tetratricopeptide repeat protein [Catellatospora citrea]RKE10641.1 hypothetical protein C8E86_5557 [Catellatospora citrea]GIG03177.1 hypothetical protein Cci01nite_82700 [Catellatospora citrea]